MIERGYAYAIAKREADSIALQFFQARYGDKDSFGTVTITFLLSRLLAHAY